MITAIFILGVISVAVSLMSLGLVYLMYLRVEGLVDEADQHNADTLAAVVDLAKSASINRKESAIVQKNTVDRIEGNVGEIKDQVNNVPHLTAEEVVKHLKDGDSVH